MLNQIAQLTGKPTALEAQLGSSLAHHDAKVVDVGPGKVPEGSGL